MVFEFVKAALSFLGLAQQQSETNRKFRLDDAIEAQLIKLLSNPKYRKRTLKVILRKIGGFDAEPDELRRHLVRIGAERSGIPGEGEFWELPAAKRTSPISVTTSRPWLWFGGIVLVLLAAGAAIWKFEAAKSSCPQICDQSTMNWEEYRECRKCNGLPD